MRDGEREGVLLGTGNLDGKALAGVIGRAGEVRLGGTTRGASAEGAELASPGSYDASRSEGFGCSTGVGGFGCSVGVGCSRGSTGSSGKRSGASTDRVLAAAFDSRFVEASPAGSAALAVSGSCMTSVDVERIDTRGSTSERRAALARELAGRPLVRAAGGPVSGGGGAATVVCCAICACTSDRRAALERRLEASADDSLRSVRISERRRALTCEARRTFLCDADVRGSATGAAPALRSSPACTCAASAAVRGTTASSCTKAPARRSCGCVLGRPARAASARRERIACTAELVAKEERFAGVGEVLSLDRAALESSSRVSWCLFRSCERSSKEASRSVGFFVDSADAAGSRVRPGVSIGACAKL